MSVMDSSEISILCPAFVVDHNRLELGAELLVEGTEAIGFGDRGATRHQEMIKTVADVVRQHNDLVHKGKRSFVAQARCWPGGGPAQLLFPAEPIFFIQRPQEVHIIWQRDHHVRRVRMNAAHDRNAKPSWFGDSVGHYEGDTLVVDTVNFAMHQYHFVDNFRTPHSEQLHVVERWRTIDDGKRLEVEVTVEDPKAFTTPWKGTRIWQKVTRGPMLESVCAENNINPFNLDEYPMPEATKADF